MKTVKILLFLGLCIGPCFGVSAQKVSLDSLKRAVEHSIGKSGLVRLSELQLGCSYFIEDVSTREPITKKRYGIFEFGLYGDDVPRWVMWYDPTGYKIYGGRLKTEMLGEILDFLERNNYSATESFYYIKGLHRSCKDAESVGIQIFTKDPQSEE